MPKETILVIDDEKDLIKLLRYNLEREGYRVLSAESGEAGLDLAKTSKPAVVVLDLMLPAIDGLEVCRLLKADPATKRIPVMMLTAKGTDIDQVVGLELGAADYVTKPFSVKVLLARVKNVLKRSALQGGEEAAVLECCGIVLDKEKHLLSVKGRRVDLTKTEFGILSVLMRKPQIVVSRDRLVSEVWGASALVSSSAVNMHIKGLRKKLGEFGDSVQTVRGSGFKFC